jgi:O-antigen/teichoic acid export membrane protein
LPALEDPSALAALRRSGGQVPDDGRSIHASLQGLIDGFVAVGVATVRLLQTITTGCLMSLFSYELGREDGKREERNRNSGGGCAICFWVMVAICAPLGLVGYFRWGWKQVFHVEPPAFAEVMVGALVVLALLAIAVDEYRKKRRGQSRNFKFRRMFVITFAGGAFVGALIVAIELAGLGVNGHHSAVAATHVQSTHRHRSKRH